MKTLLAASAMATVAAAAFANAPKNTASNTPPAADPNAGNAPAAGVAGTTATDKPKIKRSPGKIFEIRADVKKPEGRAIGGNLTNRSMYPFDKLEVGQSFGVSDKERDQLSSIVSNQNRAKGNQRKVVGPDGNPIPITVESKDANGNVIGTLPTGEFQMERIKEFSLVEADKDDPDGAKFRIFRDK